MKIVRRVPRKGTGQAINEYPVVLVLTREESSKLLTRGSYDTEVSEWGIQQYGRMPKNWLFGGFPLKAYFFSEADALLFAMRWVGE